MPEEEGTTEEEKVKAAFMAEAQALMMSDQTIKDYAACFLVGQQLCGYSAWQMMNSIIHEHPQEIVAAITRTMAEVARQGGHPGQILQNLKGPVTNMLKADASKARQRHRMAKEVMGSIGCQLPFKTLNTRLGGGMQSGNVLVLRGESKAIGEALDLIGESFIETKVSFRHFVNAVVTEESHTQFVGLKWWGSGCNTHSQAKQVFAPFKEYKAVLIDDLSQLVTRGTNSQEQLNRAVKRISQSIDRKKQVVIVGLDTAKADSYPTVMADTVHIADVALRKLEEGGPDVLMVAGEIIVLDEYEEKKNGGGNDQRAGDSHDTEGGVEGSAPGAEDGKPEGSGEDQGEGRGVLGDSGGDSEVQPDDTDG